jgi:hypothetical protein
MGAVRDVRIHRRQGGTTLARGRTQLPWWDSLHDLDTIHIYAHPDYGTRVEWSDGNVEEL